MSKYQGLNRSQLMDELMKRGYVVDMGGTEEVFIKKLEDIDNQKEEDNMPVDQVHLDTTAAKFNLEGTISTQENDRYANIQYTETDTSRPTTALSGESTISNMTVKPTGMEMKRLLLEAQARVEEDQPLLQQSQTSVVARLEVIVRQYVELQQQSENRMAEVLRQNAEVLRQNAEIIRQIDEEQKERKKINLALRNVLDNLSGPPKKKCTIQ
ncbi:Krt79 [Acrasis kona]|uniref:Krt79 n=1 Tax=Acrasis kona TaxID=1008807 RepID=A0AAW2ZE29_9EUKA